MTRLAILADLHGNLPALEAIIDDLAQFEIDHVIVAGDIINGAPFSSEVLERIFDLRWSVIRGNHEFYLLDYDTPREREHMRGQPLPAYLNEMLVGWRSIIAAMPDELTLFYPDAPPVRIVHGIPGDHFQAITPNTSEEQIYEWLDGVQEAVLVAGHYHIAFERQVGPWHILNPGPAGMPCDGIPKPGYLLLESDDNGWQASFRRVEYNPESIYRAFEAQNLIERLDYVGFLHEAQFKMARPLINSFMRWCEVNHPDEQKTIALAQRFLDEGDIWPYLGENYQVNRELLP